MKLLRDRKHLSYIHVSVTLRTIFESTQNLFPNLWGRQLTERFFLIQFVRGTVCIENFELAITVDAPRYVSQQGTTFNLETVCILLSMILSDHILKKWIRCQLWTLHRKVLTKLHMKNMQIYSKVPCITKMNNMSWEQHNTQFWLYERNYPCERFLELLTFLIDKKSNSIEVYTSQARILFKISNHIPYWTLHLPKNDAVSKKENVFSIFTELSMR